MFPGSIDGAGVGIAAIRGDVVIAGVPGYQRQVGEIGGGGKHEENRSEANEEYNQQSTEDISAT
jgi:hypothetical protein